MISINPSNTLLDDLARTLDQHKDAKASKLINAAIDVALSAHLQPANCPAEYAAQGKSIVIRLNPVKMRKIEGLVDAAKSTALNPSKASIVMGLLAAVAKSQVHSDSADDEQPKAFEWDAWIEKAGFSRRVEQAQLIGESIRHLTSSIHPYVLCEASVGVGKSLALAAIAIHHKLHSGCTGSVVMCAPTYQVATQLFQATEKLLSANAMDFSLSLLRSKAEFVSATLLKEHLSSPDVDLDEDVKTKAQELLDESQYYRHDYESIGLDTSILSLSRSFSPDDEAMRAYYEERKAIKSTDIVVCTHAMLAAHVSAIRGGYFRQKTGSPATGNDFREVNNEICTELERSFEEKEPPGLLPRISLLLVDEAHQIADTFRSIRSQNLSLGSLKKAIMGAVPEKIISKASATDACEIIDRFIDEIALDTEWIPTSRTQHLLNNIKPLLVSKRHSSSLNRFLVQEALSILENMCRSNDRRQSVYRSPIKGYLSIRNNPAIPIDWLDLSWKLSEKMVMVSGTLSIGAQDRSYAMIAAKLAIPQNRMQAIPPIETPWLRKNVKMLAPAATTDMTECSEKYRGTAFMVAEEQKDTKQVKRWVREQAKYIASTVQQRPGGCIVFCTSYEQIDLLYKEVSRLTSDIGDLCVMKSKQGRSITAHRDDYIAIYNAQNKRPLWIAISSVGTGIDITDHEVPANQDNMVSTIILTRIPIRPMKSNENRANSQFISTLREALILTKQIFGRLVRRPGRSNMEIHVMDARATVKKGKFALFYRLMMRYTLSEIKMR